VLFCCDTSLAFASAETPIPNVAIAKAIPNTFFIVLCHLSPKNLVGLPTGNLERARLIFKTPSASAWLQAIATPHGAKKDNLVDLENLSFGISLALVCPVNKL
jgi:hypothetical protein